MQKLTPNFSFSFEGIIWNMMLDELGEILILEIRQNQKHQVSFTAIELETGDVIWDGLEFEENWWVGMTALSKGILLLHTYKDNVDPEPKGLIAFDVLNQQICWMHEMFTYLKLAGNQVVGFNGSNKDKQYEIIGLTDGKREAVDESTVLLLHDGQKDIADTQYPLHYKEGTPYFDTCKTFLYNRLHLQAVNAIEYLELKNKIIVSYYIHDSKLVNYLLIMETEGDIIFHEPIQKNINAVGLETFFIVKNHLIFVKDKNEIFCYNL